MSKVKLYIASKIKEYRKINNYKQEQLGDLLGLTRTSIINIESGRHALSAEKLYHVACIFKIGIEKLYPPSKNITIRKRIEKRTIVKKKIKFYPII